MLVDATSRSFNIQQDILHTCKEKIGKPTLCLKRHTTNNTDPENVYNSDIFQYCDSKLYVQSTS